MPAYLRRRLATVAIVVASVIVAAAVIFVLTNPGDDAPSKRITVAFLGDSYTQGTGASSPAERWTSLVCAHFDWREENLGVGGTGYDTSSGQGGPYAKRMAQVADLAPDIVVVSGGLNDLLAESESPRAVIAAITGVFRRLRAALPHARIVAVRPFFPAIDPPDELILIARAVQRAVGAVHGRYLEIGDPLRGHPNYIAPDHLHPNDAGYLALAVAFEHAYAT